MFLNDATVKHFDNPKVVLTLWDAYATPSPSPPRLRHERNTRINLILRPYTFKAYT